MPAISIRHLDVIFGNNTKAALDLLDLGKTRQEILEATGTVVGVHDASLEVERGEICVLMGLSGSGKSSLLRAINGLNKISRGSLRIEDGDRKVDLAKCQEATLRHLRKQRVSMVFQKFALMPWLSVLDNVAFGLEMQGLNKAARREQALEKLALVGLADWAKKYPHELSGGMQQRVGLARAFAMDSDILLMDEPFSALDPLIRSQLQDELLDLQQSLQKTIVFVSHDLDEALKIGTHIAIMESAKIIQHGKPEEIVLKPNSDYVRRFVAHTNPLNVLRGHSMMTRLSHPVTPDVPYLLDAANQTCLVSDALGHLSAVHKGEALSLLHWHEGESMEAMNPSTLVIAPPDISMRDAIEIRYRTGLPILLGTGNDLVGLLSDKDFYHALLGKHFQSQVA
jgi:glycine betaine/proline transport system ATP-binding protein